MSTGAKIGMGLFKWLVVPVALGFIGYTFIGPNIGRRPPERLKEIQDRIVQPAVTPTIKRDEAATSPDVVSTEWPEPTAVVELKELNGRRVNDREVSEKPTMEEQIPERVGASEANGTPETEPPAGMDGQDGAGSGEGTPEPTPEPAPEPTLPDGPGL